MIADTAAALGREPVDQTVVLVPYQDYVVFFNVDAADMPGTEVIEELRVQARQRLAGPTLGPRAEAVLQTIAQLAASGIVGGAAWAPFPAVVQYVTRWRSRSRRPLPPQQVLGNAVAACGQTIGAGTVEVPAEAGQSFQMIFSGPIGRVIVHADPSGHMYTVTVEPRSITPER